MEDNAKRIASRFVNALVDFPPGMGPGDEALPEPEWYGASADDVYEQADPEQLSIAMREAIAEAAYGLLTPNAVNELAEDYYSPMSVDLDWDSATLHFGRSRSTASISGAPESFSVRIPNPFVE